MKDLEKIISYLDNEMTGQDLALMETELANNPKFQEYVRLAREVDSTLADTEFIEYLEKVHKAKDEITETPLPAEKETEKNKTTERTFRLRFGWNLTTVAATLALIVTTIALVRILSKPSDEQIFAQYYTKYEANLITRSETSDNNSLISAIQLYDKGSYAAAIQKFQVIIRNDQGNTAARFFLGVSYLEIKNFPKAIENLRFVIAQNDTAFVEHAQWYLALSYIKNGQKKEAIELLSRISNSQNFYKIMAMDVLKRMR